MKPRSINANKPHIWKADIAASVDRFNEWFMRFAPEAFRSTRVETTKNVRAALLATNDLRILDAATLKANPGALPTLRMCTAPPLAVDRLVGLADASKNLVGRMELPRGSTGCGNIGSTTWRNWGYSKDDRATRKPN